MLPSCAGCNQRKGIKDLGDIIRKDPTYDLLTGADEMGHLNSSTRNVLANALKIKRENRELLRR